MKKDAILKWIGRIVDIIIIIGLLFSYFEINSSVIVKLYAFIYPFFKWLNIIGSCLITIATLAVLNKDIRNSTVHKQREVLQKYYKDGKNRIVAYVLNGMLIVSGILAENFFVSYIVICYMTLSYLYFNVILKQEYDLIIEEEIKATEDALKAQFDNLEKK